MAWAVGHGRMGDPPCIGSWLSGKVGQRLAGRERTAINLECRSLSQTLDQVVRSRGCDEKLVHRHSTKQPNSAAEWKTED